ncbi:type II secretion system minor pseudopilin GspK [Oceanicoccus sp. KOV_DT_Chl]|uniref:type II secretion system minor pseudopilin GspK n=1 Tax=Oceanicoccus sp. KOV_DT_Chl TaxID=1904639 RepID=UPI000C7D3262|nr:type II secretion system minor pseudopilin GspK [Oceanicoccus sp. KOV_DT_Chl]
MYIASPHRKGSAPQRQQGAALILALVIVVMVVLIASSLNSDFLVTFKRVENQLHGKQAFAYLRGAEGIARQVLQEDHIAKTGKDHRSEGWLQQRIEFPMDQGAIAGTLCDLQGRFNLNNLRGATTGFSPDQQIFIRLLQTLELENPLDEFQAKELTQAVTDWIDPDDISINSGAENSDYADLEVPMRPGNQDLHRVSELRWVKGINADIFKALAPLVVALPAGVSLNINTADPQLLRAINVDGDLQPLSEGDAESIKSDRDGDVSVELAAQQAGGFDDVEKFVDAHPATALPGIDLAVESSFFLLKTETIFLDREARLYSVLHRNKDGDIKTIARARSGLGECEAE